MKKSLNGLFPSEKANQTCTWKEYLVRSKEHYRSIGKFTAEIDKRLSTTISGADYSLLVNYLMYCRKSFFRAVDDEKVFIALEIIKKEIEIEKDYWNLWGGFKPFNQRDSKVRKLKDLVIKQPLG